MEGLLGGRTRWLVLGSVLSMGCGGTVATVGGAPGDRGNAGEGGVVGVEASADGGQSDVTDAGPGDHEAATTDSCCAPPSLPLAPPTFSPPSGTALLPGTVITMQAGPNAPPGTQIFFTTDGTTPPPCGSSSCPGLVYAGPVQMSFPAGSNETVIAVAHDPGGVFGDSPAATAEYTMVSFCCDYAPVIFQPTSTTSNNDFLVKLTAPGPTLSVCYTLDGTTPTCSMGVCTGSSLTYDDAARISINGTVTSAATGQVTVTAIDCGAGIGSGAPVSQQYTLQVADPTMPFGGGEVPPGVGLSALWMPGTAGLTPSLQTATSDSIVGPDPVAILYTTGVTPPTCTMGTSVPRSTQLLVNANTTYQVMACKHGYVPSAVEAFPVRIQENPPALAPGGPSNVYPSPFALSETTSPAGSAAPPATAGIVDAMNAGGAGGAGPSGQSDWVCATAGTGASCGASFDTCGAGNVLVTASGGSVAVPAAATTTVSAVACGVGVQPSETIAVTYTVGP